MILYVSIARLVSKSLIVQKQNFLHICSNGLAFRTWLCKDTTWDFKLLASGHHPSFRKSLWNVPRRWKRRWQKWFKVEKIGSDLKSAPKKWAFKMGPLFPFSNGAYCGEGGREGERERERERGREGGGNIEDKCEQLASTSNKNKKSDQECLINFWIAASFVFCTNSNFCWLDKNAK